MDGPAARGLGGRNQIRDPEVALHRRRRSDADRLVGQTDVQRVPVGGRVDGDRLDVELVERADDPDGYLTPVRDENAREHACSVRRQTAGGPTTGSSSNSSVPNSTAWPLST